MKKQRSPSQQATARQNGKKGGRPRKSGLTPQQVVEVRLLMASERLRHERPENLQFLVDLRDGLIPGATVQDRLRAVESMLDRDPETVRIRGEVDRPDDAGDVKEPPKLFDLAPGFEPPPGWRETPAEPAADDAKPLSKDQA